MSGLARRSFRSSSRLLFSRSHSHSGIKALGDPPIVHSRRVVVTGLGMVSPLGCGVETTWNRLLKGECGIRGLTPDDLKMNSFDRETQLYTYEQLSSKVAAIVPCGTKPHEFDEELWLNCKGVFLVWEELPNFKFVLEMVCISCSYATSISKGLANESAGSPSIDGSRIAKPTLHAILPKVTTGKIYKRSLDHEHRSIARFIGYALCAAHEALKDANWLPSEQDQKERTGVSIGGGIGSISDILDAAQMICEKRIRRLSPFFIPRILINMASGHVSMQYGFQGPNHAAVTACATGAHSIGDSARMIQFGDADVMVAGGTESSIDALSIAGFCRSRALTTKFNSVPQEASRPFDYSRDGFVIGEGSGVLVLEELEHAKRRGAKIYGELRGYGTSGDAYHITQPHIDGRGAILAMTRALKQSGLLPEQVDYINAHATSTPLGDVVEANAIRSVFSDHATSGALAFSSTKGAVGHLLGAAGAVEAIFTILAIHHGIAPLTLNLKKPDPIFTNSYMPLNASKKMPIRAALSNSFGFGGTNTSLLFTATS